MHLKIQHLLTSSVITPTAYPFIDASLHNFDAPDPIVGVVASSLLMPSKWGSTYPGVTQPSIDSSAHIIAPMSPGGKRDGVRIGAIGCVLGISHSCNYLPQHDAHSSHFHSFHHSDWGLV